mgnify:FL=1
MRSETAERIRACSKLYGQQIDAKDIGQLQEMATAIGINDQDTMFLLLLVLQSHFKAVSSLNDGVLDAQEKVSGVFDEKIKHVVDRIYISSKKVLISGGICLGLLVASLACGGGYLGSQQFYEQRIDSEIMGSIRACTKAGGSVQNSGNSGRLACFPPDGKGFFLE